MDTELMLDVGQANELKMAFRRAGWTNGDIKKLSEGDLAATVLPVIRGTGEITIVRHVIDLSAPPVLPKEWSEKDWEVIEHIPGPADFEWDPEKVKLWLSDQQKGDKSVEGNKLLKEIRKRGPTFNANLLDYLYAHPNLVPEDWQIVFFMDTVYRGRDSGYQCVRYLYRDGRGLYWDHYWLDLIWRSHNPSAAPASF